MENKFKNISQGRLSSKQFNAKLSSLFSSGNVNNNIMNLEKKFEEFEEKRNNNLADRLLRTKEDILIHIDKRIREIPVHQTAPNTLLEIQKLKDFNQKQEEKITLMACQVNEMYAIFTSTNFLLKFSIKLFGAIGIITGAIIGVIELIKRSK